MKIFLKKIFLFVAPIFVLLATIFLIRTNREFCYNYIKGDCDARGKLFYKKLYAGNRNVDYLFVGSSKTMNGINDRLIEDSLNARQHNKIHLYNAGYCRFGRNLDFLFCKEFAKENKLKKIFLEVRYDESTTSHPVYSYLANGKEILSGIKVLNGKILSEIYNHLLMNINYTRCLIHLEHPEKNAERFQQYGYNNIEKILDKHLLEEFYNEEKEKFSSISINKKALEYKYSSFYIQKIHHLCKKNNIELNFIYLPSFGNVTKLPVFLEEYSKMGKVIIGPDSIFNSYSYWKDVAHFNTSGATAYSNFLAKNLLSN